MMINRETRVYGSFAKRAGNRGCKIFNNAFRYHELNSIYKSFSIENIESGVLSARCLNFSGFAVTMPFKKEVLNFVDIISSDVDKMGAANTIILEKDGYKAYNTDYIAAMEYIKNEIICLEGADLKGSIYDLVKEKDIKLFILGNGGYASAVKHASERLDIPFQNIKRESWTDIESIENSIVYNCTPVESIVLDKSNFFIDCNTASNTGRKLGMIQASHQYMLYTGLNFPFNYIS